MNYSIANFEMFIWNKGIGPAIIKDVKIVYQGIMYEDWQRQRVFQAMTGIQENIPFAYAQIGKNRVMQAGENIPWCQFGPSPKSYKVIKAMENSPPEVFDIIILYSDIYGHTWVTRRYDRTEECDNCAQEVLKGYKKFVP